MQQLKKLWKNWNESVMFLIGIAVFLISPTIYRLADPTAGAFDLGILQVAIIGFFLVNFILFAAWLNYRLTFPLLHQWFDNDMEGSVMFARNIFASKVSIIVYFAYVAVYTVIFAVLI